MKFKMEAHNATLTAAISTGYFTDEEKDSEHVRTLRLSATIVLSIQLPFLNIRPKITAIIAEMDPIKN